MTRRQIVLGIANGTLILVILASWMWMILHPSKHRRKKKKREGL